MSALVMLAALRITVYQCINCMNLSWFLPEMVFLVFGVAVML